VGKNRSLATDTGRKDQKPAGHLPVQGEDYEK